MAEGSRRRTRLAHVPEGLDGERVDAALARMFGLSRSAAAQLAEAGNVQLNGAVANKGARVSADQLIEILFPEEAAWSPPNESDHADVRIIHEDDDVVVVEKPVGVVAHPTVGFQGPSVTGVMTARGIRIATSGAPERQGVVQRLDVGTSGLMVLAKSEAAYSDLKQQFRDRVPEKVYHALVQGLPDPVRGTIDAPIGRHPNHDWKFAVRADGRPSITHYEVLEAFRFASLLEVHLETGRTHQIRVHMAATRHPCVGDLTYGADPTLAARVGLDRQWLHAVGLGFRHPASGDWVAFTSEYPADLARALKVLTPD
jgi:23S rRNA pseudouridine1911/1915/1917 synthase